MYFSKIQKFCCYFFTSLPFLSREIKVEEVKAKYTGRLMKCIKISRSHFLKPFIFKMWPN